MLTRIIFQSREKQPGERILMIGRWRSALQKPPKKVAAAVKMGSEFSDTGRCGATEEVMATLKGPARTAQLVVMAPLVPPRGGLLALLALLLVLLGEAGGSGGCPPQCKCLWR